MTTQRFFNALISLVADLSRDLPAEQRYQRLLQTMLEIFPCDAAALLQLEGNSLRPLAIDGLSSDTMGRRFVVNDHPRLAKLLHSREPVRFAADSDLPDPYDGLVETHDHQLHVHDCMGVSLYIDEQPWGALTLDALQPGTFDGIDPLELRTFISLSEATVKAAERIDELAARAEREHLVARTLIEEGGSAEIIGTSTPMQRMKQELEIVAKSHLTVLILGETGVGKELVARQIHTLSPRAEQPLVQVNCAALPENIAESELFGHTKGAFTGAVSERAGKFEIADGGTLFLDEIGELPLTIQAKMLRALQSGEIQRVGSDHPIQVDVRIVAATNRDLQKEVAEGRFRADLYHRLSVYPVKVPPLRERDKDVLLLAGYLLETNQRRLGVQGLRLNREAKQQLLAYPWPGNVRELEHMLSRAALKAIAEQGRDSRTVTISASLLDIGSGKTAQDYLQPDEQAQDQAHEAMLYEALPQQTLKESVDNFQRELITRTLSRNGGNQAATARELGLNRSNFYRLLQRLELR
ncbi:MAG: nitric oxide reductase transcriptional regulator NorR [Pseudomonadales bacterium]